MSRDIRSFFLPKGKKVESQPLDVVSHKKKKKRILIDSDSDEPKEISPKKKETPRSNKKYKDQKSAEKLKPINVTDLFGNEKVKRSAPILKTSVKKESKCESNSPLKEYEGIHSDEEFEATLSQIDLIEKAAVLKTSEARNTDLVLHEPKHVEKGDKHVRKNGKIVQHEKNNSPDKKEKLPNEAKKSKDKNNEELSSKCVDEDILSKSVCHDDSISSPIDPVEKRRQQAESYMRYLNRGGPKHLGSKEVPKGNAGCLSGLVFVISGVLDSLEREDASQLIEQYGGKVTSNVSRNTNYLICGEEAGRTKLNKAETLGTPVINEDGLFDLIKCRSKNQSSEKLDISEISHKKKNYKETSEISLKRKKSDECDEGNYKLFKKSKEESQLKKTDEKCSELKKAVKIKYSPPKDECDEENNKQFKKSKEESKLKKTEEKCSELEKAVKIKYSPQKDLEEGNNIQNKYVSMKGPEENNAKIGIERKKISSILDFVNVSSSLWVDKYKPTKTKQVIGQQGDRSSLKKLSLWLGNWHKHHSGNKKLTKPSPWAKNDDGAFFKAALLSGPPGIGKTTMAHLVSKELGYDVVEFNASDTRSKKLLHMEISEMLSTKSIFGYFHPGSENHQPSVKHVLIMDEVDGMAGNQDRGGVQELIQLIKNTRVPIICMCNDRNHPKIRSLANYCFDLRVMKPRLEQIRGAMMSVCYKEGLKLSADTLNDIICGANFDIRQILHHLSLWSAKEKLLPSSDLKGAPKPKKDMKIGPWDVVKKVFSIDDHQTMSIHDKSDLFFNDYSISPLFVQENYLSVSPSAGKGSIAKTLQCIASAAESISMGDVVDKSIRSRGSWSLLPLQAMFSSVIPGDVMEGYMKGQINFPAWLGKNSRTGKLDRLLQELHVHTRLTTSGSKQALNMEYMPHIRDAIIQPLAMEGSAGVPDALHVMQTYNVLREDLESILELTLWPNQKDPMSSIESKVKAALTRAYNKEGILTPYSVVSVVKKRSADVSDNYGESEEEGAGEEDENVDDVSVDAMIKTKKKQKNDGEGSSKGHRGKGRGGSDTNSSRGTQKRGRGK